MPAALEKKGMFYLGKLYDPQTGKIKDEPLLYSSQNLTTHAVCIGMTGSGKTGLGITLLEEAALNAIPSIIIDPKGDMGNILLTFPDLSAEEFKPWIDEGEAEKKGESADAYAEEVAKDWREGLKAWGESPKRIQDLKSAVSMEIYTPASQAGIPLSILGSFEAPNAEFAADADAVREKILSTTASILGLLGIAADPVKSREHILIATIIEQAWKQGKDIEIPELIQQVQKPNFDKIGVLDIETFFPAKDRMALSIKLNNLLASPGFQAWMQGVPLDIQQLLYTPEKKPKISVISIAHLNDSERMFFVTLFLNQLIVWMRKQTGTSSLRAIFYMDEILGYFPPTALPPSKMPMLTLLKQARAFGLGMVLCTQNPVDLDYKGLSNCGTWFIGRLQTARDKSRVIEGLSAASNGDIDLKELDALMSGMSKRVFIMRSVHEKKPVIFQTRWALSYLRGPLTLAQIKILSKDMRKTVAAVASTKELNTTPAENKPVIAGDIPQYYVNAVNSAAVNYRPSIAGFAKLHFVDKKNNVDAWVDACLVCDAEDGKTVQWEIAENQPDLKQKFARSPVENATYQNPPLALLQEKKLKSLKQDLFNYIYQTKTLGLFACKEVSLISEVNESEADFRQKVALALKERREALEKKLHDEYDKKIAALTEKIRQAEAKKDTQEQQSLYQKLTAFLSFITTLLGVLLSGKKLTKTTINQAGTSFKRLGRVSKENQDVTHAEQNLQTLQQQLQDIQTQLEAEMAKLPAVDSNSLKLEEVTIRPRKSDITIDEIALVWRPN